MKLPSASKLALAELCAYPWTSGEKWPFEPDSKASAYGKLVHKYAELRINGDCDGAEDIRRNSYGVDQARLARDCASIDDVLGADQYEWREAEAPLAYNPLAREARLAEGRKDKRDGEQLVICDVIMMQENGILLVRDWKSGKPAYEPATENPQIKMQAVAAAKLYGVDSVDVELLYLTQSGPYRNRGTMDSLDLMAAEAWLSRLVEGLPARTEPTPGAHCGERNGGMYCPLRLVCQKSTFKKGRR